MGGPRVAIVGGGAAGLVAAIVAARAGAGVTVLESAQRLGQKILKTGNGRCNITNMLARPEDYNDPAHVAPILEAHSPEAVRSFFESIGLLTVEEVEGRVYPLSNAASSVLDALRLACARLGVVVECDKQVEDVRQARDGFALACADGTTFEADRVIVATGGASDLLRRAGHELAPFEPALCPVRTETHMLKGLSGVRAHVSVRAYDNQDGVDFYFDETGEVQFRDYGLSGIVIFDLSRLVKPGDRIELDFLTGMREDEFAAWLERRFACVEAEAKVYGSELPSWSDFLCGCFHSRVNNVIIRAAGLKPSQMIDGSRLSRIARAASCIELRATGLVEASAQVTRGGALVSEFDPRTLESRIVPGLYAAGETLNVDGRCGGYNLQWAWASGLAAGAAAAQGE